MQFRPIRWLDFLSEVYSINDYFSNIKAVINTFICRKKTSKLMTPPWPLSSLYARLFYECIFESRLKNKKTFVVDGMRSLAHQR